MPTKAELIELRDVLLKHAFGQSAERQRQALAYIFNRMIDEGEACTLILPEKITILLYPVGEKTNPAHPKEATYGLMRDIGDALEEFYGDGKSKGKSPHRESHRVKYRADFVARGNYALTFKPYFPQKPEIDLVSLFWKPHLPPQGVGKILYPEPIFLMDERQTYFRNTAVGTGPDASALAYLNIPGKLQPGYSYVSSGVVQAMFLLTKALRLYYHERPDFPDCEAVKPHDSIPPGNGDLILLSTPSSTNLVDTIQGGQMMTVDAEGAHYQGQAHNDDEHMHWGVVTRTRQSHRIVTMLAARHGRSVEAMAKFLTLDSQLALLARRVGCMNGFPEIFQVLFRMPAWRTREGPIVRDAVIENFYVPEERSQDAAAG